MTLANDVKAKLAFQPGDAEALAMEVHELEQGFLAWTKVIKPVRLMGMTETKQKAGAAVDALWRDYLANGLSEGMATRALLTVTK